MIDTSKGFIVEYILQCYYQDEGYKVIKTDHFDKYTQAKQHAIQAAKQSRRDAWIGTGTGNYDGEYIAKVTEDGQVSVINDKVKHCDWINE